MEGLFRAGIPKGGVIQLTFHADSHIAPTLQRYKQSRTRNDPIVATNTDEVIHFLDKGRRGLKACSNIRVRNFRLFVAVSLPGDCPELPTPEDFTDASKTGPLLDIKRQINETLKAALLSPRHMSPTDLLEWTRRLFNSYPDNYPEQNFNSYSPDIPLRKQIINSETIIREEKDHIQVGDNYFCCTTPKTIPREIDPLQTNSLFGEYGVWYRMPTRLRPTFSIPSMLSLNEDLKPGSTANVTCF
jgi:conjugal transfer ATP-binding protein TraC